MDLSWSDAEVAFREEARGWLVDNLEAWRAECGGSPRSGDTREGFARAPALGAAAVRRPVGGGVVAGGLRRARRVAVGVAALRGGVLPGRRSPAGDAERDLPAGPHRVRVRHRRSSRTTSSRAWRRPTDLWCQGWSEPNAGSDLAGVRSKARRVDGGWVLDGQKTWTTRGAFCTHLFGLFRTDPASERHKGLSYLLVPLDTPGVTVRGFGRLDGDEGFAEVFFEDAFLADDALPGGVVLGEVDQGWSVAMATTGSERGLTLRSPGRFTATADRLLDLYRAKGSPAHLRHRVVDAWMRAEAYQLFTLETVTTLSEGGAIGAGVVDQQDLVERARRGAARDRPRPDRRGPRPRRRRGRRATSSPCPARSTPAPTRSSGTSPPNGCWGSPADEVRPHRRPGRPARRGARAARQGAARRVRAPTTRSSPWA